jgi:hypothetical protein
LREKPAEISLGLDNYEEREWRQLPGLLAAPFKKAPARDAAIGTAPKAGRVTPDHDR